MSWELDVCQALADQVLAALDDDLAEPIRSLPMERRITDRELLQVQTVRLLRQLLEKLEHRNDSGEARSNG